MNFEAPADFARVAHLDRLASPSPSSPLPAHPRLGGDDTLWWKLSTIITCGTLAGAIIPELVKIFTSTESAHVREVVTASREGGASLNVLSGLVAGNFSAYWMGIVIVALMGVAYLVSLQGFESPHARPRGLRVRPRGLRLPRHGPGHHRGRLVRPVTDNAQSVYELSMIETIPNIKEEVKKDFGFDPTSRRPNTSSRRTTARATPSRRRPSPCSSAPRSSARRR
jgi:K(+)-stimulated pyrophosphate-energized sodium pump